MRIHANNTQGSQRPVSISHRMLSNISWNFVGQVFVAVFAFFATPYIVRKLGVELYALYGLVGIIIGYFSFMQFGIGTAAVKFIAAHFAQRDKDQVRAVFWTSLSAHAVLGVAGMFSIMILAPFLATHFLKAPLALYKMATAVFCLAAVGFLTGLIAGAVNSVMQGAGRFDIISKAGIVTGILQLASAVLLLKIGYSLKEVIVAGIIIQILGICWYWHKIKELFPYLSRPLIRRKEVRRLFIFGGFVTVSSIVGPLLVNIEKIFLAALVPMSALTYYLVPFSVMDRLSIIRGSVSPVLFPTFSALHESGERSVTAELHVRSSLMIFFMNAFFVLFFMIMGKPFLLCWMGKDFAEKSAEILGVLSAAGIVNAIAAPSYSVLQGSGRPRVTAIIHIAETVVYIPGAYFLIKFFGAFGAAEAWFWRVAIDSALLIFASCRMLGVSAVSWCAAFIRHAFVPVAVCAALLSAMSISGIPLLSLAGITTMIFIFCIYGLCVWFFGLDAIARERLFLFMRRAWSQ